MIWWFEFSSNFWFTQPTVQLQLSDYMQVSNWWFFYAFFLWSGVGGLWTEIVIFTQLQLFERID